MKKHLAWFFPIAFVALAVSQVSIADDGPELFVIPQAKRKPLVQAGAKNTVPAQAAANQAAPVQPVIKKTTPAQPAVATPAAARTDEVKTVPVQAGTNMRVPGHAGTNMTVPGHAGTNMTVPDGKTPYTVNRPITMPSQMPNNLASRSLDRILSGAGPGTIGSYQARLELRRDGTFVVTGKIEGSGTWYQSGEMIVMESRNSHYEGKLENSLLSGTRTFKARAGSEPWKFVLNDRALEIKFQPEGR